MTPIAVSTTETRLLVVDDNEPAGWTLSLLLKRLGYQVETCYEGPAAFAVADALRPDALLLDLAMPGQDGYQICRMIRQQPWGRAVIIIALTGYGGEEDQRRTREAGFDGHLVKPVDLGALTTLLTNLLTKDPNRAELA